MKPLAARHAVLLGPSRPTPSGGRGTKSPTLVGGPAKAGGKRVNLDQRCLVIAAGVRHGRSRDTAGCSRNVSGGRGNKAPGRLLCRRPSLLPTVGMRGPTRSRAQRHDPLSGPKWWLRLAACCSTKPALSGLHTHCMYVKASTPTRMKARHPQSCVATPPTPPLLSVCALSHPIGLCSATDQQRV